MILCSSSLVVPSCMRAVEGAHGIVLTAPLCRAVEQDEMMATKSGPSDKSSLSKMGFRTFPEKSLVRV